LALLLAGCFGGEGEGDAAVAEATPETGTTQEASESQSGGGGIAGTRERMEEMGRQMEDAQNRTVEPVDFRSLRALLPETAGGLEQTEREGQKGGAMGMTVSTAEATYEGADRRRIEIKITDMGAVSGFAALGFGWAMIEIDKESGSGYEKTTTYENYRAHEKYNRDRQRGEMQVLVADRFAVEVTGRNVEMQAVKDALGEIDLGALADMKDEGIQEG
jgi:hypothetical protein